MNRVKDPHTFWNAKPSPNESRKTEPHTCECGADLTETGSLDICDDGYERGHAEYSGGKWYLSHDLVYKPETVKLYCVGCGREFDLDSLHEELEQ